MISIKDIPQRGQIPEEGGRASSREEASPCQHAEVRCGCGSLLAKLVAGSVELKCRRCKQTWRIPLDAG